MKKIYLLVLLIGIVNHAFSANQYRTKSNGNYSNPAIWEVKSGLVWIASGSAPINADATYITISSNTIVTLDVNVQLNNTVVGQAANFEVQPNGHLIFEGGHTITAQVTANAADKSGYKIYSNATIEVKQTGDFIKFVSQLSTSTGGFVGFAWNTTSIIAPINLRYIDAGSISTSDILSEYGLLYLDNTTFTFDVTGATVDNLSSWNNTIINVNTATTISSYFQCFNSTFNLNASLTYSAINEFQSPTSTFTSGANAELHYISNNGGNEIPPFPSLKKLEVNISQGQYLSLNDDLKITASQGLILVKGDVYASLNRKLILESDTPVYATALSTVYGKVSIKVQTSTPATFEYINFPIGYGHTSMPMRVNLSTNGTGSCYLTASVQNVAPSGTADKVTLGGSMSDRYYMLKVEQPDPFVNSNKISSIANIELEPTGISPALTSFSKIGFSYNNTNDSYTGITSSVSNPKITSLQLNTAQITDLGNGDGSYIGIAQQPLSAGVYCVGTSASYTPPAGVLNPSSYVNGSNPYNTLEDAFADLEFRGVSGNIIFELQNNYSSNSEPNQLSITYKGSSTRKATIRVRSDRISSLSYSKNTSQAMLRFDGAAYVTINGAMNFTSCGVNKGITLTNTSALSGSRLITINNGSNNIIISDVLCKVPPANTDNVGIYLACNSNDTLSNSNISITCNRFEPISSASTSSNAIEVGSCTSLFRNKNIVINNNEFDACGSFVIDVHPTSNASGSWIITNNSFYKNLGGGSFSYFLYFNPSDTVSANISGNYFGGSGKLCSGAKFDMVSSNEIVNVSVSKESSQQALFSNNHFENMDENFIVNGFALTYFGSAGWDIVGNNFGSTTVSNDLSSAVNLNFSGINVSNSDATNAKPIVISNNTFNHIQFTALPNASSEFNGIKVNSVGSGIIAIENNSFKNILHGARSFFPIYCSAENGTHTCSNNVFENVNAQGDGTASLIYLSGSNYDVKKNKMGRTTFSEDLVFKHQSMFAISTGSIGGYLHCDSNEVYNVSLSNSTINSLSSIMLFLQSSSSDFTVSENYIQTINSSSSKGYAENDPSHTLTGIKVYGSLNNAVQVHHNSISNLIVSNTTTTQALSVCGLYSECKGQIYNNAIYYLLNLGISIATKPYIIGMRINFQKDTVYNNVISITNDGYANPVTIYGMLKESDFNASIKLLHNSVYIGGSANGGKSFALYKNTQNTNADSTYNNIFYNKRFGGDHFAAGSLALGGYWGEANNNLFYSLDSTKIGGFSGGTVFKSFSQWKALLIGRDVNSVMGPVNFVNPIIGNLHLSATGNCHVSDKGALGLGITTDIDGAIRNNPPDIGADEFNYSPFTVTSTSNSPVCGPGTSIMLQATTTATSPVFSWSGPNSFSSSSANPSIPSPSNALHNGSYTITISDANGCTVSSVTNVIVNDLAAWYTDQDNDGYYTGSAVWSCTSPGQYYTTNVTGGGDCNDSNPVVHPNAVEICGNNVDDNCNGTVDEACNTLHTLAGKVFIQGYYIGSGQMTPALNNQGVAAPITITDSILVELRNVADPNSIAFSSLTSLGVDGEFTIIGVPQNLLGNTYYLVVTHRNSVQTWSDMLTLVTYTYHNFTTHAYQAFGSNQTEVESNVWAIYSGDCNQDGAIDALDYLIMDPDIVAGNSGYLATDLNGDGSVDALDYLVVDPNIVNGVSVAVP